MTFTVGRQPLILNDIMFFNISHTHDPVELGVNLSVQTGYCSTMYLYKSYK